jgi:hypothetical protein
MLQLHSEVLMSQRHFLSLLARQSETGGFTLLACAWRLILPLTSGVILAGIFTSPAFANDPDPDGYIQNWNGKIWPTFTFNSNPPLPLALVLSTPIPTLSQDVTKAVPQGILCGTIRDAVAKRLGSGFGQWDSCTTSGDPELRGKMLGTNRLGLKIRFSQISFSFDYSAPTNPTINVTADLELDAVVHFASSVDGTTFMLGPVPNNPAFSSTPASVESAAVGFSNANVSSSNIAVSILNTASGILGGPTLGSLGAELNRTIVDQKTRLNQSIQQQNPTLNFGAFLLGIKLRTSNELGVPPDPNANYVFLLTVSINPEQFLVINYQRNGSSPPAPDNCFFSSLSYAEVEAMCYSFTPSGLTFDSLDPMRMERLDPKTGAWLIVDNGVSNSWDTPPPRFSVPFFVDDSLDQASPPKTATYRVTAFNQSGESPGVSTVVTIDTSLQAFNPGHSPACGRGSVPYRRCMAVSVATH